MIEYKGITPKLGFRHRNQTLEDLLNQYGREGWHLKSIDDHLTTIIFEREKNR